MIRALIVDEEPLSRKRLRGLLADEPEIEVIGECDDGYKAVVAFEKLNPDLVFLDVKLPGLDGFGVLENIGVDRIPAVVFVTADDRHALRAFDVHAIDYVLKPFGLERLQRALDHVRGQIARDPTGSLSNDVVMSPRHRYLKRIVTKKDGRLVFLRIADVDWIEASGNYVRLHVAGEWHRLRRRMSVLESHLDPDQFLRIHRSTIVNIDRIREMRSRLHGDYLVILHDGRQLTMSASYREKLDDLRGNMPTA
jgi:two-component system, LytTR family, response regulator